MNYEKVRAALSETAKLMGEGFNFEACNNGYSYNPTITKDFGNEKLFVIYGDDEQIGFFTDDWSDPDNYDTEKHYKDIDCDLVLTDFALDPVIMAPLFLAIYNKVIKG